MTDSYTEEKREVFGEMGEVFQESRTRTDLDDLHEVTEESVVTFCPSCGSALPESDYARRCVRCSGLVCNLCAVNAFQEKTMCRDCLTAEVPKDQWLPLLLAKHGLLDGAGTEADDGGDVPDRRDSVFNALQDAGLIGPDGELTAQGRFVYHLGIELYGEDPDTKEFVRELNVQKVVERR